MKRILLFCILLFVSNTLWADQPVHLNELKLPPGFHISVYAHVPNAREMALGPDGTIFVGTRNSGDVYAVVKQANGKPKVLTIAKGLFMPNGVAYHDGDLYVAAVDKVLRYDNIMAHLNHPPKPQIINQQLPSESHHGWRYIKFGPDRRLYLGIGAPCNVCIKKNPLFATISSMKADGSDLQVYAKGVRNTVGFAWEPTTEHLWFTDNGRDYLGDNLPPDEVNVATHAGMNFGFPYFYGNNKPDPKYGRMKTAAGMTEPVLNLPAHVAPLGLMFYQGKMFPKTYDSTVLIAEHGSWNRSSKVGYRVIAVTLRDNKPYSYKPFISGWLQGQNNWGRPVDLLTLADGSVLVSDDYAGVIYRVTYH